MLKGKAVKQFNREINKEYAVFSKPNEIKQSFARNKTVE